MAAALVFSGAQLAGAQAHIRFDFMSAAEAGHVVQRRHERRRRHRAHARDRAEALDPLIDRGQRLDALIREGQRPIHLPHHGKERRHLRQQAPGQRQVADAPDEGIGPTAADPPAGLPQP